MSSTQLSFLHTFWMGRSPSSNGHLFLSWFKSTNECCVNFCWYGMVWPLFHRLRYLWQNRKQRPWTPLILHLLKDILSVTFCSQLVWTSNDQKDICLYQQSCLYTACTLAKFKLLWIVCWDLFLLQTKDYTPCLQIIDLWIVLPLKCFCLWSPPTYLYRFWSQHRYYKMVLHLSARWQ